MRGKCRIRRLRLARDEAPDARPEALGELAELRTCEELRLEGLELLLIAFRRPQLLDPQGDEPVELAPQRMVRIGPCLLEESGGRGHDLAQEIGVGPEQVEQARQLGPDLVANALERLGLAEQAADPSIMRAPWPSTLPALVDRRAEDDFDRVRDVVSAIRSFRADHHVESDAKMRVHLSAADATVAESLGRQQATIALLGRVQEVTLQGAREGAREGSGPATRLVAGAVDIVIPLEGVLDLDEERTRLAKALEKVRSEIARFTGKLASEGFRSKAPADVVAGEQRKLDEARATEGKLQNQLQEIGG